MNIDTDVSIYLLYHFKFIATLYFLRVKCHTANSFLLIETVTNCYLNTNSHFWLIGKLTWESLCVTFYQNLKLKQWYLLRNYVLYLFIWQIWSSKNKATCSSLYSQITTKAEPEPPDSVQRSLSSLWSEKFHFLSGKVINIWGQRMTQISKDKKNFRQWL